MTNIKIEVGSEWVLKVREERRCKILYVGKEALFAEWIGGVESEYKISDFLSAYKPAPVRRTVWFNVYPECVLRYKDKENADKNKCIGLLWQQEVVIADPANSVDPAIGALTDALEAMCAEFRAADLPYGSVGYRKAREALEQFGK